MNPEFEEVKPSLPLAAPGCPQKDALPQCIANSQRPVRPDRCAAAVAEVALNQAPRSRCYWRQCRNKRPTVSEEPFCRMHRNVRDATRMAIFQYEPGATTCGFELVPLDRETPVSVPVYMLEDRLSQGLLTVADLLSQVKGLPADTKQLEQKLKGLPRPATLPAGAQAQWQSITAYQTDVQAIEQALRQVYPSAVGNTAGQVKQLVQERNQLLDRLQRSVDDVTAAVSAVSARR